MISRGPNHLWVCFSVNWSSSDPSCSDLLLQALPSFHSLPSWWKAAWWWVVGVDGVNVRLRSLCWPVLVQTAGCDWSHDRCVCSFITQALYKSHQSTGLLSLIMPVAAATRHMLIKSWWLLFLCYLKPERGVNTEIQSPVWGLRPRSHGHLRFCVFDVISFNVLKLSGLQMGQWWDLPVFFWRPKDLCRF